MKNRDITPRIQVKFNQFVKRITRIFSKPKQKFIKDMIFGILRSGDVKLNSISRMLEEEISIKKTSERLGRNLKEPEFDKELNKELSFIHKKELDKDDSYLILDLSDLGKPNAEKMEGLSKVRDGSSGEDNPKLINGYHLCNVIGRVSTEDTIYPLYSELYSIKKELTSENERILEAINTVSENIDKGTWVLDRGGDRDMIITPLLKKKLCFIIRQTGQRNLKHLDKELPFPEISKKVKLRYTFKSKKHEFKCGVIPVNYKKLDNLLWLVVSRYKDGGYFYLLCHFPEIFNPKTAVIKAMEGYSLRWSIEEVHRHVKKDFNLEDVRLLTYQSLKNLMPLLWTAISYLYVKLKPISLEMIVKSKIKVLVKERIREIT